MSEHRELVRPAVSEEAAEWFVRLRDGLSPAEQREYLRWLKASPDHIAEALRMAQVYGLLRCSRLRQIQSQSLWNQGLANQSLSNVIELRRPAIVPADDAGATVRRVVPRWRSPTRWHSRILARAMTVLTIILGAAIFALASFMMRPATMRTEASEWRHFALTDGSIVRAGPRTRLRFEFSDERRSVHLSGGEAFFQVAKDPTRPFMVTSGRAVVRALGTEFGVARTSKRVLVTVVEGSVAVSQEPSTFRLGAKLDRTILQIVPVAAGEQASVPDTGRVRVQSVDVASELAWTQGRLIFDDKNVAEAVEEFNRRNRVQIEISDQAIAARPVRGVFDVADPESFAQFVARHAQAVIVRDRPGVLRLHAASAHREGVQPGVPAPRLPLASAQGLIR